MSREPGASFFSLTPDRVLDADPGLTNPANTALNLKVRLMLDQIVDEEH